MTAGGLEDSPRREALRDSEVSYRRLFESAKDGILILNSSTGRIDDVNPYLSKLLGFSHDEMLGRTVGELSPFKNMESNQIMLERLQRNGYVRYNDLPLKTRDGRDVDVEFISNVYQAGEKSVIQCNVRDITARKKSEERLTLLNSCVANLNDVVLITESEPIDEPGPRIVFVNEAFERITGYTAAETIGRSPRFLQGETTDKRILAEVRDALEKKIAIRTQLINCKKDGTEYWMDIDIVPILNGAGQCTHFAAIERDITEAKRKDESLLLFRTLMEKSPDAIEIIDPGTGRFLDVNETACRRLGYSREEMLSLCFTDVVAEEERPVEMHSIVEDLRKTGVNIVETQHRRKDGTMFPCEVNVQYIDLNKGYLVALVRDITERKRNEGRFHRLVDSNAQGVYFWNTKGEITGANDAFLHLMGYSRADLEAGLLNWIAMTPPEYAEADRRCMEKIAAKGVCSPFEKQYIRNDGPRVPVIIGAASFEDSPEEGVCFVIDLTERKQLEKQFLRAQRMESIGTLAGGIAHDLNNILAPIMLSIDVLKTMTDNEKAATILETIEISAKRGADIVRQVLSFARGLDGERIEIQPKHLLKDIEGIIKNTFPKDIRLRFFVPNDTWTILGDPTQVNQVLLNLCVNARDAMPKGGSLTINAENCVIDEHFSAMNPDARAGRYVRINVADTGTGIAPLIVDRIFEPFFTTKEVLKGTGLGLSTVIAVVKSHGGIVNVYSELGKGTLFAVYLPATEKTADELKGLPEQITLPRGHGETVLVVDDENSILVVTSQTLEAFGYRVMTAADGADAVAIYAEHKAEIAVILTDMAMPIMNGPATIRAVTRINPDVKIIAASGHNANMSASNTAVPTVKHFLTKPYSTGTLLRTLRAVLEA